MIGIPPFNPALAGQTDPAFITQADRPAAVFARDDRIPLPVVVVDSHYVPTHTQHSTNLASQQL